MNGRKPVVAIGCLVLLLAVCAGCAGVKPSVPLEEDGAQKRAERNIDVAGDFDKRRDFAEFQAAHARWLEGDHAGCLDRLQAMLTRNPDHLDARLLMTDVLLAQNKPQDAIRVLEPAIEKHPHDARVQHSMGMLLDAAGAHQGAQAHYEQAVKLDPTNEIYQVSHQEAVSAESGPTPPPPVAPNPLRKPSTHGPTTRARFLVSESPTHRAEKEDSHEDTDSAVAPTASTTEDLVQKGCEAMAEGNNRLAVAYFQRAIADGPNDSQIVITSALAALRYNRPEVAIEILRPAVAQFPGSAALERILGTAYYRSGDYRASQLALQQALSLDNSNALSYFLMGCTLMKLGNPDAAEQHFRQARLLDPKYSVRR